MEKWQYDTIRSYDGLNSMYSSIYGCSICRVSSNCNVPADCGYDQHKIPEHLEDHRPISYPYGDLLVYHDNQLEEIICGQQTGLKKLDTTGFMVAT